MQLEKERKEREEAEKRGETLAESEDSVSMSSEEDEEEKLAFELASKDVDAIVTTPRRLVIKGPDY